MNYAGILEPLLASLEHGRGSGTGRLAGQRVVTPRQDVSVLLAVDGEQNVHFLLSPAPPSDARFTRFNLQALTIARREWAVGGHAASAYLDLTCTGGTEAAYRRPFLSFCEDLLIDLERPGSMPEEAAFRTCSRWQRFWTADEGGPVSVEWTRGLLGELRFLELLVQTIGPRAVSTWTGPDAQDHDFQAMSRVAFEVKVSSTVPYTIECNLNQLDSSLFDELYLVCFQAVRTDAGEAITDVVTRIEAELRDEEATVDEFYRRLHSAGYRRQRRSEYEAFRFTVDTPHFYAVGPDFPRITSASFSTPLDARIRGIRYMLQLVGVEAVGPRNDALQKAIRRLLYPDLS
jgi:hypothetical protein